jgi:hypothetical protein
MRQGRRTGVVCLDETDLSFHRREYERLVTDLEDSARSTYLGVAATARPTQLVLSAKRRFQNLVGQAFQPDAPVRLESLTYVLKPLLIRPTPFSPGGQGAAGTRYVTAPQWMPQSGCSLLPVA